MEASEKLTSPSVGLQYASFWADVLNMMADSIEVAAKAGLATTAIEAANLIRGTAKFIQRPEKDE